MISKAPSKLVFAGLCTLVTACVSVESLPLQDDLFANEDFLLAGKQEVDAAMAALSLQPSAPQSPEGEIAIRDLVTPRMLVQLRLLGIEAEASAFDHLGEQNAELVLYLSYREHKVGSSGQKVSSIEPQRTSYLRIKRPKQPVQQYRAGSQLFGGPVVLTEDLVTLEVEVHEIDEIDQSTRDRVGQLYQSFDRTDLSVAPDVMREALNLPILSYVPLAFSLWEIGVAAYNSINSNDVLAESPLVLTLDHDRAYMPSAESFSQIRGGQDGITTQAEFNPDGVRPCSATVCRGTGTVRSIIHTFKTEDLSPNAKGLRLVFAVTARPVSD